TPRTSRKAEAAETAATGAAGSRCRAISAKWRSRFHATATGASNRRSCRSMSGVLRASTTRSSPCTRAGCPRGMSTRDIQAHWMEIYGVEVSAGLVSEVTDAVMEDVRAWQSRPLEPLYMILYLDALVVKMRHEGRVENRAGFVAIGITQEGSKEVLGLWTSATEGAKLWMQILTEIRNRGVQDILIACVDGLKGFPDAIQAVYPNTEVQLCIVHMVRNSLAYVSWKDRKQVAADLKLIYRAATAEQGQRHLEE